MTMLTRGHGGRGRRLVVVVVVLLASLATTMSKSLSTTDAMERMIIPTGFGVNVFRDKMDGVRFLTVSPSGIVYASGRGLRALEDKDKDGVADKVYVFKSTPEGINGIAFHDGDLYVVVTTGVWKYVDVESDLSNPLEAVFVVGLPAYSWHGGRQIKVSPAPESMLYISVGAPCNVPCDDDCNCLTQNAMLGTIQRVRLDGSGMETFATGLRNCEGLAFDPEDGSLWFTDNGRDNWGDVPLRYHRPPCELNHAPTEGLDFGFPKCFGYDEVDFEFNPEGNCEGLTPAARSLDTHVAPLGLNFYTGTMFPAHYHGGILIAEHGSWNRNPPAGYQLSFVPVHEDGSLGYEPLVSGMLYGQTCESDAECLGSAKCQDYMGPPSYCQGWGRPVDVVNLADGSILFSDEGMGVVWRLSYGEGPSVSKGKFTAGDMGFVIIGGSIVLASLVVGTVLYLRRKEAQMSPVTLSYRGLVNSDGEDDDNDGSGPIQAGDQELQVRATTTLEGVHPRAVE